MNEQRYKREHLKPYRGILTSEVQNGSFKMELKVGENPVLQRSKEIEFNIELDFKYDYSYSPQFFHNIHSCQIEKCSECEKVRKIYSRFETDLSSLQLGDTFEISAALINNRYSELPREIGNIKVYEPLLVACPDYYSQNSLRLPDTTEGIKKKKELDDQRLQQEREEEEKRKEEEEKRKEEEEKRKEEEKKRKKAEKWDRLEQWLAKYPNILKIGGAILGVTVLNQIDHIFKGLKSLFKLIFPN